MFHFGLKTLAYTVKFDSSCYELDALCKDILIPRFLLGYCFGFNFENNSIRLSWYPSKRAFDKIDLFVDITNLEVIKESHYIGTIQTNKEYLITILNNFKTNNYFIEIWSLSQDNKTMLRVYDYSSQFKYPYLKIGCVIDDIRSYNIFLERE